MTSKKLTTKKWPARVFWSLIVAVVFFAGLYVYLIDDSVSKIALRNGNEQQAGEMEVSVSTLESSYLAKLGEVNMDYASRLGFIDASKSTTYAVLNQSTVGLVAVKNEI
ncbi:MAG: hypothetical protein NTV48_02785 [Candidatus Vogelbacteria bacterium]|nr:hypothetical protein [Candidatus Vogelbacteria bacterium]